MKVRPKGYYSIGGEPLQAWPPVGTILDLPDMVAKDLIGSDKAEKVLIGKPTPSAAKTQPAPPPNQGYQAIQCR